MEDYPAASHGVNNYWWGTMTGLVDRFYQASLGVYTAAYDRPVWLVLVPEAF